MHVGAWGGRWLSHAVVDVVLGCLVQVLITHTAISRGLVYQWWECQTGIQKTWVRIPACPQVFFLAGSVARSCTSDSARILHVNVFFLAGSGARSCTSGSARILHVNVFLQDSCYLGLAWLARKWPNYVQDCKISASLARWFARFSIILQQDL